MDTNLADAILANTIPVWAYYRTDDGKIAKLETGITGGSGKYVDDLPGEPRTVTCEPGAPGDGYFVRFGDETVGEISFKTLWSGQDKATDHIARAIMAWLVIAEPGLNASVMLDPDATIATIIP